MFLCVCLCAGICTHATQLLGFCFCKARNNFSSWPLRKRRSTEAETGRIWNEIEGWHSFSCLTSPRPSRLSPKRLKPCQLFVAGGHEDSAVVGAASAFRAPWRSLVAKPLLCFRCLSSPGKTSTKLCDLFGSLWSHS